MCARSHTFVCIHAKGVVIFFLSIASGHFPASKHLAYSCTKTCIAWITACDVSFLRQRNASRNAVPTDPVDRERDVCIWYIYIYIYIYLYMYPRMHAYIYTHAYIYMHVNDKKHVHTHPPPCQRQHDFPAICYVHRAI